LWRREGSGEGSEEGSASRVGGKFAGKAAGTSRAFCPPLRSGAAACAVNVIEVELSTTGWGEEAWSEVDAVRLDGTIAAEAVRPDIKRQPWETGRAHASRVSFVVATFGTTTPTEPIELLRQHALAMVHTNMALLGCSYPAQVERSAGGHPAQAGQCQSGQSQSGHHRRSGLAVSGFAVSGEMQSNLAAQA